MKSVQVAVVGIVPVISVVACYRFGYPGCRIYFAQADSNIIVSAGSIKGGVILKKSLQIEDDRCSEFRVIRNRKIADTVDS